MHVSWPISIIIIPWRAKDDLIPLSSNTQRPPKQITDRISEDGLAELFSVDFAIFYNPIDFDISLSVDNINGTRGTNYKSPGIGRESQ